MNTPDATPEEVARTGVTRPALLSGSLPAAGRRLRPLLARLLPALRAVAFVGAVAIVAAMAVRAVRDLDTRDLAWWPLPLAFAGAVTWWLLQARGWSLVVVGRSRRRDMSVWCRTQALRYLPGGIWAPASRATLVRGSFLERVSTVAADNLIALCAAVSIGGVALAAAGHLLWFPLALAVTVPLLASRLVVRQTRIAPARILRATPTYVAGFLAYSLSAVLVQTAVSGWHDPLAVAGAAALAWSAGFAVVIAPSGLGVREVVYVALLVDTFPTAELAAAAVAMRVVMILAELAVLVLVGRPGEGRPRGAEAGPTIP